jgi:RNA polymerase sigma-70 factor, ECF subfamily
MASGRESWDWSMIRQRCRAEALKIVRRPHDADEVVQEALTRAWRGAASCRTPEAPLPWCLQITRNEALRLIARRQRLPTSELPESDRELPDRRTGDESERALERVVVGRALAELRPEERLLISLRYEGGCSHPEIAAALAIPEATARVRLHRLHKRLQTILAAKGYEVDD